MILDSEFVTIDEVIRAKLSALKKQSGWGAGALLKGQRDKAPDGLGAGLIYHWMNHHGASARREHLDYVITRWKEIIANGQHFVELPPETLNDLKGYRARSQIGVARLFKTAQNLPDNLTPSMVNRWFSGKQKTVRHDHLEFVLRLWASMPEDSARQHNAARRGLKAIPCDTLERLKDLKTKSGLGGETIIAMGDAPEGLNANIINNWFSGVTGSARPEHLDFVLKQLEEYCAQKSAKIDFSADMRMMLEKHRKRSGVSQGELMKEVKDIPEGLTTAHITKWINNPPKMINANHYAFILKAWEALPDKV